VHLTLQSWNCWWPLYPLLLNSLLLTLLILLVLLSLRKLLLPLRVLLLLLIWLLLLLLSASTETSLLWLPAALPGSSTSKSSTLSLSWRKRTSSKLMAHLTASETTARLLMLLSASVTREW
jgi:hypothetical protein